MSWLRVTDPSAAARLVADSLVIHADPHARATNPYHWYRTQPLTERLARLAGDEDAAPFAPAARRLLAAPERPEHHRALVAALIPMIEKFPERMRPLTDLAWQTTQRGRIGHHLGAAVGPDAPPAPSAPATAPVPERTGVPGPAAQVVVPFRDGGGGGERLRNLLACLAALRDQDEVPGGYTVTVVEADREPRRRELIAPLADEYLFAPHPGAFNKAWVVNAGVANSAVRAETVCVFDADLLPDRGFVARSLARFREPGVGAFLPYRDMLYLDEGSSVRAVRTRGPGGEPALDPAALRGFWMRRPVGGCVWLTREVFDRIGGMDERYENWGGEDVDLVLRLQSATALYAYDDFMVHLHHPVRPLRPEEARQNDEIPYMTWKPAGPIGRLDRYLVE
ncbi:galactosyltransferase-related protein [Kitasatospora cineracea]|uniref:Glycosyl transferase family 2 n=1 Tax=Kitasatospora cineracea TaxID=88074 RepID=A0A8G1UGU2_9ACTN|nr:galactosyltransferase-related protein [Kitasatospora cineracea]ROR43696.1 glycosyl transferase family 2 [Kitasatospora cineracea]